METPTITRTVPAVFWRSYDGIPAVAAVRNGDDVTVTLTVLGYADMLAAARRNIEAGTVGARATLDTLTGPRPTTITNRMAAVWGQLVPIETRD